MSSDISYEEDIGWNDTMGFRRDVELTDQKQCFDSESVITGESFDMTDDDLFTIYELKTGNKFFEKGYCGLKSELISALSSDYMNDSPGYFMSIGTTPKLKSDHLTGLTSKPTTKIIIKLLNNMYISLDSAYKLLNDENNIWFALPLYNNRNRRVVNINGLYGESMNHGQVPGFKIYRLYSKDELSELILVNENAIFINTDKKLLTDYLEEENISTIDFIIDILDKLIPNVDFVNRYIEELFIEAREALLVNNETINVFLSTRNLLRMNTSRQKELFVSIIGLNNFIEGAGDEMGQLYEEYFDEFKRNVLAIPGLMNKTLSIKVLFDMLKSYSITRYIEDLEYDFDTQIPVYLFKDIKGLESIFIKLMHKILSMMKYLKSEYYKSVTENVDLYAHDLYMFSKNINLTLQEIGVFIKFIYMITTLTDIDPLHSGDIGDIAAISETLHHDISITDISLIDNAYEGVLVRIIDEAMRIRGTDEEIVDNYVSLIEDGWMELEFIDEESYTTISKIIVLLTNSVNANILHR